VEEERSTIILSTTHAHTITTGNSKFKISTKKIWMQSYQNKSGLDLHKLNLLKEENSWLASGSRTQSLVCKLG
jgi:hypothetical protein